MKTFPSVFLSSPRSMLPYVWHFLSLALLLLSCGQQNTSEVWKFSGFQRTGHDLPLGTLALTFDDGPGEKTAELLDLLQLHQTPAAFFVAGENAERNLPILARIQKEKHLLANHSYSHPYLTTLPDDQAYREVQRTDAIIAPYVTDNVFMFRAPYGDWSVRLMRYFNATALKKYVGSIYWDIGGWTTDRYRADWDCWARAESVATCTEGYLNEIRDNRRGIILAHDVHNKTIEMMRVLIPQLKQEGFKFVRLDEVPNIQQALKNDEGLSEPLFAYKTL